MNTLELAEPETHAASKTEAIQFPEGLPGYSGVTEYVLVNRQEEKPFLWLQMLGGPKRAILVVPPQFLHADYQPDLSDLDVAFLELNNSSEACVLNTVTTTSGDGKATVNLNSPIVINRRTWIGKQVIPKNAAQFANEYPVAGELTSAVKAVVSGISSRRQEPEGKPNFQGLAKEPAYQKALETYTADPTVMFELSSRCNFHCHYCRSPLSTRGKCFMKRELFSHLVRQAKDITTQPLRLHVDGEPTLHPEFLEMALEANAAGHRLALATNGSALKPEFLQINMSLVMNLSCSPAELAARTPIEYARYHARIAEYLLAWKNGPSKQDIQFKIYMSARDRENAAGWEVRLCFARKYVQDLGLGDGQTWKEEGMTCCYTFAKPGGGRFSLSLQPLAEGGCYPNPDGNACPGTPLREDYGFCDSPWKVLAVLADGTLAFCCVDVTGKTGCVRPNELWQTGLKEIWLHHPALQKARQEFLAGKISRPICRKCLESATDREMYLFPELFPFPTN